MVIDLRLLTWRRPWVESGSPYGCEQFVGIQSSGEARMTTITLPADIEGPLAEEARRRGTTPERLALDALRLRFAPLFHRRQSSRRSRTWPTSWPATSGPSRAPWKRFPNAVASELRRDWLKRHCERGRDADRHRRLLQAFPALTAVAAPSPTAFEPPGPRRALKARQEIAAQEILPEDDDAGY